MQCLLLFMNVVIRILDYMAACLDPLYIIFRPIWNTASVSRWFLNLWLLSSLQLSKLAIIALWQIVTVTVASVENYVHKILLCDPRSEVTHFRTSSNMPILFRIFYLYFEQLMHNIYTLITYNYIWFTATCFDINTSSAGSSSCLAKITQIVVLDKMDLLKYKT